MMRIVVVDADYSQIIGVLLLLSVKKEQGKNCVEES